MFVWIASKGWTRRGIYFQYVVKENHGIEEGERNISTSLWNWRGMFNKWFIKKIGSAQTREM